MDAELSVVRGRIFANEVVRLDGTEFVDCAFRHCELTYSGGLPFIFENSPVDGCELVFVGRAENTLHTLAAMHRYGLKAFVEQFFDRIRDPFETPAG
jgi:hypothetical protein